MVSFVSVKNDDFFLFTRNISRIKSAIWCDIYEEMSEIYALSRIRVAINN